MPLASPKVLVIAGAVLILLVFVLSLIFFEVIPISRLSFGGLAPGVNTAMAPCPDRPEGNQLVLSLGQTGDIVSGVLYGKIERVDLSPTGKEGVFDIISLDEAQTYTFGAEEKEGLVYDRIQGGGGQLRDLAAGQTISVDFSCNPVTAQAGVLNDFQISLIEITEK